MMRFTVARRAALLACVALSLGGCQTMGETFSSIKESFSDIRFPTIRPAGETQPQNEVIVADQAVTPCPPVVIVDELRTLHQFIDDSAPKAENMVSALSFTSVRSTCRINDNNIVVDLDIAFEGELGPRARDWKMDRPSFAYPYFIAITTPDGGIAAKEVFGATVSYDKGETHIVHEENMRQIIPLNGDVAHGSHEILVGFQLTDTELAYNRMLMDEAYEPPYMAPGPAAAAAPASIVAPPVKAEKTVAPVPPKAPERPQQAAVETPEPPPPAAPPPEPAPAPVVEAPAPVVETPAPAPAPVPSAPETAAPPPSPAPAPVEEAEDAQMPPEEELQSAPGESGDITAPAP